MITYLLTHGAEPFLRSRQFCSYSRISQHFMEPGGSLPCSQEPSTAPYPEPDQSNPYHPILSPYVHFNIVHPPTPWSSQWFLSFWLPHQYPICIPTLKTAPPHHTSSYPGTQLIKHCKMLRLSLSYPENIVISDI
jgi:hypothetical protein